MRRTQPVRQLAEAVQDDPFVGKSRFNFRPVGRDCNLKTHRIFAEDIHLIQHWSRIFRDENHRIHLTWRTIQPQDLMRGKGVADIDKARLKPPAKPVAVKGTKIGTLGTTKNHLSHLLDLLKNIAQPPQKRQSFDCR